MIEQFTFKRVDLDTPLKPFDCIPDDVRPLPVSSACKDLNDFFIDDAIPHLRELLAVTCVFESETETAAFFSVLNDRITKTDSSRSIFDKLRNTIPKGKRYSSIPAVKIGRFGVHKDYQGTGIGTEIMDFIKVTFTTANRTGCRCITVDAYNIERTINFYLKNGFNFLTNQDNKEETRLMFFDLMRFVR